MTPQSFLTFTASAAGPRCLILAPHPDDESIGCGGTILYLLRKGVDVRVLFLTYREGLSRGSEGIAAMAILGVQNYGFLDLTDGRVLADKPTIQALLNWMDGWKPTSYFVPHSLDLHPDHRQSFLMVRQIASDADLVYLYEVWSPLSIYNCSIDISVVYSVKERALEQYCSQERAYSLMRGARALAEFRGATRPIRKCGKAEVFLSRTGLELRSNLLEYL